MSEATSLLKKHTTTEIDIEQGDVYSIQELTKELEGGERLMYNDYTTIDWLQSHVHAQQRSRKLLHESKELPWPPMSPVRTAIRRLTSVALWKKVWDDMNGWIAVALIGALTAVAASAVDLAVAFVFDLKEGYCDRWYMDRESCTNWTQWSEVTDYPFLVYTATATVLAVSAGLVTLTTATQAGSKTIYTAAGSGIPEIKTILCGFVIKGFLSMRTLIVKCIGCIGATGSGMCLAKEGPFVHLAACVSWQVAGLFEKTRTNERKKRELLAAGTAAGLSVAFGAPIGGVLFAMEEISSFFPAKVLWRSFLCSMTAAITLRQLNPSGTGRLVMFKFDVDDSWLAEDIFSFVLLGVAGGVFGGLFCRLNFIWSKWFRSFKLIKQHQVFEVLLVVLATSALQYYNRLTIISGDKLIGEMLNAKRKVDTHVLGAGTLIKLVLTTITFGIKVPSGIIIPSLDAGAMFGRLVAIAVDTPNPGAFAIVGAAAFLGGVSRMTISLCVIMIELTGSLEYAVPTMIAVLVSKWVADAISKEGVYDLAQNIMGHPFLHPDGLVEDDLVAADLCPPRKTMDEITVVVQNGCTHVDILREKLLLLLRRGLLDAGLVITDNGILKGYLAESDLQVHLMAIPSTYHGHVNLLSGTSDYTIPIDTCPIMVDTKTPIEIVHEMFLRLGLRVLIVVDEGRLVGVIIKKRLLQFMHR